MGEKEIVHDSFFLALLHVHSVLPLGHVYYPKSTDEL